MRKFIATASALAVIMATSVSPALAAVTILDTVSADEADGTTLAAMQLQCDNLAAAHQPGNKDIWSGDVVPGDITQVSGPTVNGPRTIDQSTVQGFDFHPSVQKIVGDPYRNGGSVNMFGDAIATAGYYDYSTYNFTANYDSTFAHAFTCDISNEAYIPPVLIPGHPLEGYYINCDFGHGQGNDNSGACDDVGQPQGSCVAHTAQGASWEHWGEDTEQCKFIKTADPAEDSYTDEDWGPPTLFGNEPGVAVNQNQSDNLNAFEDHGGRVELTGEKALGQVVVCISPSSTGKKLPGEWVKKNGYDGNKCSGAWFYGTTPYSLANYAGTHTPNLNLGNGSGVTIPND